MDGTTLRTAPYRFLVQDMGLASATLEALLGLAALEKALMLATITYMRQMKDGTIGLAQFENLLVSHQDMGVILRDESSYRRLVVAHQITNNTPSSGSVKRVQPSTCAAVELRRSRYEAVKVYRGRTELARVCQELPVGTRLSRALKVALTHAARGALHRTLQQASVLTQGRTLTCAMVMQAFEFVCAGSDPALVSNLVYTARHSAHAQHQRSVPKAARKVAPRRDLTPNEMAVIFERTMCISPPTTVG